MATVFDHEMRIMHDREIYAGASCSTSCWRTEPSSRASPWAPTACAAGEACFTTAMTGYEEAVTDPSYVAQVLCFSYPLIGTYGVDEARMESDRVQCEGVVMRDARPDLARLAARAGRRRADRGRHAHARPQDPRRRRAALRARRRAGRGAARARARRAVHRRQPAAARAVDEGAVLGRRGAARRRRRPRREELDPAPARRRRASRRTSCPASGTPTRSSRPTRARC